MEKEGWYLRISFYEKWFWGVIIQRTYNTFYGLNPEAVREYHKYHFSTTVGIAVAGMAFKIVSRMGVDLLILFSNSSRFQS